MVVAMMMVMMRVRVAAAQHRHRLPSLADEEIDAERRHEREAPGLEEFRRAGDRHTGHVEDRGHHADDADGGERLHEGGEEGDGHAAPHALLVGEEIGGDDDLAVARPRRMHDPVEERYPAEPPEAAALLQRLQRLGEIAVEGGLQRRDAGNEAS